MAILTTESYFVYQEEDRLVKESYHTGEREILYQINNTNRLNVSLQGEFFLIHDGEEPGIPIRWKKGK